MRNNKLKKWELALALSLCITLCHGAAFPAMSGCSWWGVIFPGLTEFSAPAEEIETAKLRGAAVVTEGGYELHFQLLDWLRTLWS